MALRLGVAYAFTDGRGCVRTSVDTVHTQYVVFVYILLKLKINTVKRRKGNYLKCLFSHSNICIYFRTMLSVYKLIRFIRISVQCSAGASRYGRDDSVKKSTAPLCTYVPTIIYIYVYCLFAKVTPAFAYRARYVTHSNHDNYALIAL